MQNLVTDLALGEIVLTKKINRNSTSELAIAMRIKMIAYAVEVMKAPGA